MKKLSMVFLLALVANVSFSQSKVQPKVQQTPQSKQSPSPQKPIVNINGYGKIQLGMDIKDLTELSGAVVVSSTSDYFDKVYEKRNKEVYELVADTTSYYPTCGSLDKRVREFYIGAYPLTESITVNELKLKFFEGKLFHIECYGGSVNDLLEIKYGKGDLKVEKEDHTFVNGYGTKFVKTDEEYTTTWNTPKPISCYSILKSWYNDKGKELSYYKAYLYTTEYSKKIQEGEKEVTARIKAREEEKKKGLVQGF